jgi:hypothetical protein
MFFPRAAMAQIRVSARPALQAGWGCGSGAVAPLSAVRIILNVVTRAPSALGLPMATQPVAIAIWARIR